VVAYIPCVINDMFFFFSLKKNNFRSMPQNVIMIPTTNLMFFHCGIPREQTHSKELIDQMIYPLVMTEITDKI
jgi:hypothetical protein